ncbi:MAG: type I restriction endonuclease subunit R, EcoR124 family, partial [Monoglobus pectinilyticus]
KAKFASLFKDFNGCLEASKVQGFNWDKHSYADEETGKTFDVMPQFTQTQYLVLVQRYKELTERRPGDRSGEVDVPYDLVGYITEIDTGRI